MENENKPSVVEVVTPSETPSTPTVRDVTDLTADDLIYMGEQAQKRANAIKKIVTAALSITTPHDWVLIGGKPYLQESGTTKVGNLLGISFEIAPGYPIIETDSQGFKTYTYRVNAYGKTTRVVGEGSRSMKEDFFRKRGKDKILAPEEINARDVMNAALTNAKGNAIKAIVPGLKNVEVSTLEEAGIDVSRIEGYTFKEGSKGGQVKRDANATGLKCEYCNKPVTQTVASYSQTKFRNHILCTDCQKLVYDRKLDLRTLDAYKQPEPPVNTTPAPNKGVNGNASDLDDLPAPDEE